MTKKDYELIAAALRSVTVDDRIHSSDYRSGMFDAHEATCRKVSDQLQQDNPRFDHARFLAACGVKS